MVIAFVAIGALLGGALTTEGKPTNNPQSQRAKDLREAAFPAGVTDLVIVRSPRYTVDAERFRSVVGALAGKVRSAKGVASVRTYLADPHLVSRDRHAALLQFAMPKESTSGIDSVISAVRQADDDPDFALAVTGQRTVNHDFNTLSQDDLRSGELQFGLPASLIVLLLVFGAVVAGLVPLLIALPSIVVALAFVAVLGHAFTLSVFVVNMLTGMGLALGIDYALFVVSRFREERGKGRDKLDAISASAMTANRAVLFSGTTFVIAMFGMFIVPSSIMRSLAVGAILVGIVSVAASATLLPALLGALGDRVDRLRVPLVGRRLHESESPEGRIWGAIVRWVLRRPVLAAGASVALLLAAASPIFGLHTGTSGPTLLPNRFEARQGFDALQRNFPGAPQPTRFRSSLQRAPDSPASNGRSRACARPSHRTHASGRARSSVHQAATWRCSPCPSRATRRVTLPSPPCASCARRPFPPRSVTRTRRCWSAARPRRTSTTSTR
jgi:RND superfamily putative drug exporter